MSYMTFWNTGEAYGDRFFDRYLFIFDAVIEKHVAYSEANEVHNTGEIVRDAIRWSVIAPDKESAYFAFDQNFKNGFRNVEPSEVSVQAYPICAEMPNTLHK